MSEIRDMLDAARRKRGGRKPARAGDNGHTLAEPRRPDEPPETHTLPELLAMDLPEPSWAVPGILSEGLTILAGKPKLGKSWLALNLALTITAGARALGRDPLPPGDVLYLSLEDRKRRIQDRARKVLAGLAVEASPRLRIAVEWPRQPAGLEHIEAWAKGCERPALVIVDMWTLFRPPSLGGRNAYEQDYEHVSALKKLIDELHTSALLVMHCKKAKGADVIDEVSGTLGLAGSTDGTLVLTRARSENEAELFVTGRDIEEKSLALEFSPQAFTWTCSGSAAERTESKLKEAVIAMFKVNVGQILGTGEIAGRVELPDDRMHYLRNLLSRMAEQGLIDRTGPGRWRWPVQPAEGY